MELSDCLEWGAGNLANFEIVENIFEDATDCEWFSNGDDDVLQDIEDAEDSEEYVLEELGCEHIETEIEVGEFELEELN